MTHQPHVQEAERLLLDSAAVSSEPDALVYLTDENALAAAQVNATLAVAEALQNIANELHTINVAEGYDE